jgi:N,N-dimethylformamidase beta subunit-like, C-terminal
VKFVFSGVTNKTFGSYGIIGGGAAGQETDAIDFRLGTPSHALHLARSHDFPWPMTGADGMTAEEYRENIPMPRADMVFFEGPNGGAVFSVGSMAWVGALSHNYYNNDVVRISENVLRRFMDDEPFPLPEQTGWQWT